MTLVECVMQGETPVPILKVHKSSKGWYWFITEFINKDLSYMFGLIVWNRTRMAIFSYTRIRIS